MEHKVITFCVEQNVMMNRTNLLIALLCALLLLQMTSLRKFFDQKSRLGLFSDNVILSVLGVHKYYLLEKVVLSTEAIAHT
jgi:hypothetical protein